MIQIHDIGLRANIQNLNVQIVTSRYQRRHLLEQPSSETLNFKSVQTAIMTLTKAISAVTAPIAMITQAGKERAENYVSHVHIFSQIFLLRFE